MNRADWNHEITIRARDPGVRAVDWNHGITIVCPNRWTKFFYLFNGIMGGPHGHRARDAAANQGAD